MQTSISLGKCQFAWIHFPPPLCFLITRSIEQLSRIMEAHQVVPDVLDSVPKNVAVVKYPRGEMKLGNELTPTDVQNVPIEVQWPTQPDALYTVIFSDPDAPSRSKPTFKEVLHWLVVNSPGTNISAGSTVMPYRGSGAPDGTGLHRYILTVYRQPGVLSVEELQAAYPPTAILNFNTRQFVAKYNLGAPVAGNFYQAKFDEHVRERRGQRLGLAMKEHEVVPDVIDQAPTLTVEVKYPSGVIQNMGMELTPTEVKDIPEYLSWRTEPNALYSLCLTDPDAPSRADPKFREFLHWLVVNIPGNDLAAGQTLVEYIGSGPPQGSGLHRYCILVYKQAGRITPDEIPVSKTSREGRRSFKIRSFAAKYNLGEPVAGNFYQAQFDDYVPILHAQLS